MGSKTKTKKTIGKHKAHVFIGASGWSYDHWQGHFYPPDLAKKRHFEYYAGQFPTVELNATFYRLFPETTFEKWVAQAPEGFLYAVKMWRWITHRKKLIDVAEDVQNFFARAALLDKHLGPILIQLPPSLHRNDDRLLQFLECLAHSQKTIKKSFRITVEFRHQSWLDEKVFQILTENKLALCLADMPRLDFPRMATADFIYVRYHGRPSLYQSLYSQAALAPWADWLGRQLTAGRDVYAYFNNDYNAHAIANAHQLTNLLNRKMK